MEKKSSALEKSPTPLNAQIVAATIEKQAKPLIRKLENIVTISTPEQMDAAAVTLKELKEVAKLAELEEKKITGPLEQAKKAAISHFKPFRDMVAQLDTTVKLAMSIYREQAAAKVKKLEADLETGKIKKITTFTNKVAAINNTGSTAKLKKVWTAEVEDVSKVPREFMIVDMDKVRQHLRDGGKPIPGVKWYQKETIAI